MDDELSGVEEIDDFTLPAVIDVPPCGDLYPNGVKMRLGRIVEDPDEDEWEEFAFYVGEAADGEPTPAVTISKVYDRRQVRIPEVYCATTCTSLEREQFNVHGLDPVNLVGSSLISEQHKLPYGTIQSVIACSSGDSAATIEGAVKNAVLGQGTAIQCELAARERTKERRLGDRGMGRD